MNISIIPARYHSKGLKRKNVLELEGKPLIQYTIESSIGSKYIQETIVTTDDEEVKKISKKNGINNILNRSETLSQDDTKMADVVLDVLIEFKNSRNFYPENFILLQPTSPLRDSNDVDKSFELFLNSNSKSLVSVSKMKEHPYECIKLKDNKWSYLENPSKKKYRRQDFDDDYYFINGAIYILNTDFFLKTKSFIIEGETTLFKMPQEKGIDIDNSNDFDQARLILNKINLLEVKTK